MSFPYPEKPEDWQTAYTRDDAFHDSTRYGDRFMLPALFWCFFITLIYVFIFVIKLFPVGTYSLIMLGLILFFIALFSFLLIVVVRKSSSYFATSFFMQFYCPPEDINPAEIIECAFTVPICPRQRW
jgi:hypothetical protein